MYFKTFTTLIQNKSEDNLIKIIQSKYYRPLKKKDKLELLEIADLSTAKAQNLRLIYNLIFNTIDNHKTRELYIKYYKSISLKRIKESKEILKEINYGRNTTGNKR